MHHCPMKGVRLCRFGKQGLELIGDRVAGIERESPGNFRHFPQGDRRVERLADVPRKPLLKSGVARLGDEVAKV